MEETFKGRPRNLSYPSPPDRELIAHLKKPPKSHVLSRFYEDSENFKCDVGDNKKTCICSVLGQNK